MFRMRTLLLAAFAALTIWSNAAFAGITYYFPLTGYEDDDLEWHLDTGTPCEGGSTNCSSTTVGTPGVINGTANNGIIDVGERSILQALPALDRPTASNLGLP